MSNGGMHTSFNGLSSIREFSVAEIKSHLNSVLAKETKYLERTVEEFERANSKSEIMSSLESQQMFIGLIQNKVASYQDAVDALATLEKDVDTLALDISRNLPSQIVDYVTSPHKADVNPTSDKVKPHHLRKTI